MAAYLIKHSSKSYYIYHIDYAYICLVCWFVYVPVIYKAVIQYDN